MLILRQIAVALGLAIVFPLAVYYGVRTIEPPPDRESYFATGSAPSAATIAPKPSRPGARPCPEDCTGTAEQDAEAQARMDAWRAAQERFDAAQAAFARALFLVAAPVGLLGILGGGLVRPATVGTGLILGGIASIAIGYAGYWALMDDLWRFVSLAAAMAVLLWLGWRKLAPPSEPA